MSETKSEEKDQYVIGKLASGNIVIETERLRVKPRIGLLSCVSFIMGSVIGSGIFISPRGALVNSGSIGMSLVIWTLCGILSMIIGLVFAELSVVKPRSGGDYTYIKSLIGDVPAFLVAWVQTTISSAGSRAVLALVFADYLCAPIFGNCIAPDSIRKSIAAAEILMLSTTNAISVRFAATVQGIFTVIKITALGIIMTGGMIVLFRGKTENFENAFDGTTNEISSITLAIYSCMWAYSGYTTLNDITEELIEPKKNIPKAIIISITLITFIYITTNVSYFTLLSKAEFVVDSAVAFTWGDRMLGAAAIIIPLSVMCSVYGSSTGGLFIDSRVRFAASRAGHLPEVMCFLHHNTRIPIVSHLFNTVVSLVMLIPGDISSLINLVSFIGFLFQSLSITGLLRVRFENRNKPRNKEDFRLPIFVPIIALLICLFMLISPFVSNPKVEFLYGVGFILSGLVFYVPFVYFKWQIPGFDHVTLFLQLLTESCPTVLDDDK